MKHTRQEAKALGLPTCYGSVCDKHPELDGFRRVSGLHTPYNLQVIPGVDNVRKSNKFEIVA